MQKMLDNSTLTDQKPIQNRLPALREAHLAGSFQRLHELAEAMWASELYAPCLVALTALPLFTGAPLQGCALLALFFSFMTAFCSDVLSLLLPFLLFCLLSTHFYQDYSVLLAQWPLFALAAAAFGLHCFLYPAPRRGGEMTKPLLAVSAAILLGGLGSISAREYFAPVSLYYVLGLGPGMLAVYVFARSQLGRRRSYNVLARFLGMLYYAGVFTGFVVLEVYLEHMPAFLRSFTVPYFSYRNFCATILLTALPAALLPADGGKARWGGLAFLYASLLFTGSRSGLLFGTLLLAACLVWFYRRHPESRRRFRRWAAAVGIPALALLAFAVPTLFASRMEDGSLISAKDSRVTFFVQGIRDFLSSPVFGKGLGYMGNSRIFIGVSGSMVWYHNLAAQILGSLGLVGAAAYGWLYFTRARLLLTRRGGEVPVAALAAAGMLLVSMTNPGEFCPLPNELIMAALFAVVESLPKKPARAC
jgi:hypothetical protein